MGHSTYSSSELASMRADSSDDAPEPTGVDVWMCGTIYVPAYSDEGAESIVREQYLPASGELGSIDMPSDVALFKEEGHFLSGALTLYAVAKEGSPNPFAPREPWERRGCAIYTEGDGKPGGAQVVADLHGRLESWEVQAIVDAHNRDAGF